MTQLIQCVPNFSNADDPYIIQQIIDAITSIPKIIFIHQDSNLSANRTVLTFVSSPEYISQAAFQAIKTASELIDMRKHTGTHPRLGATDICPLIPLHNITLEECSIHAINLAKRVSTELNIPTYLYEASASSPERKDLSFIRKGQYESLPEKLIKLPPDFGPQNYNEHIAKTGATIIGARNFLLAYNINIDTKDLNIAKKIAKELRTTLPHIKTLAWNIPEFNTLQISTNLTDPQITTPLCAYDTTKQIAQKYNVNITGSELVGTIPQDLLLNTGQLIAKKLQFKCGLRPTELINMTISHLNLNDKKHFNKNAQILVTSSILEQFCKQEP